MKRTALRLTMAAAVMAVGALTASAQDMKAEIPFPFQAGHAWMQPGTYQVLLNRQAGGFMVVQLRNTDTHKSVLAVPVVGNAKSTSRAVIRFACVESRCQLEQLSSGDSMTYVFAKSKDAGARTATIALLPNADE